MNVLPELADRPYLMVEKTQDSYIYKVVYLIPMKCSSNNSNNKNEELQSCLKEKEKLATL